MRSDEKADLASHLCTWEVWEALAPQAPDADGPVGRASGSEVDGSSRREQPWRITATPEEIVTFNPNVSALFPGSVVQSAPAIQQGRLVPAGIEDAERASLRIVIDTLSSGESITVDRPAHGMVMNAVKSAVEGKPATYSGIVFRTVGSHTGAQTALGLGLSASYLGFGDAPEVEGQRKDGRNAVAVYLRERAYAAACDVPSANALISNAFTGQRLAELVDSGAMGPENPPVLVSHVTYGRVLAFVITSTATEENLDQAVKASYSGFATISSELKQQHQEVLGNAEITLLTPGSKPAIVQEQLKSGGLANSFGKRQYMADYSPIGFTLTTLDGRPATKSETADYQKITWL
ncbi:thiol-activated cytolysin family protein [Streptomyces sp. AK02-04a]|uniref:thiol-activated cytolysin family protein n=1 Tax=Streptomyces sp. AK02-04a TaxID=3028649 RepID=UPI0029AAF6CA|nr:thiol-activated cytolysin family protein [Streptomyces sp. AK02-04a]MDX3763347.1 thiol-activated cytolysin family protein [Streptomyces sp. AK02-04a]